MTEKHEKDLHQLEKDLNFCNEIISGMEKSNKQLEVIRLDLTKKHQSKKDRLKLMTEKIAGLESEIDAFKSKDKNKRSQLVIESTYKLSLNVKSTMSSTQDEKTLENKQDLSRIIIDESEKIKIEAGNDIEAIDKDMISSSCFEDTYPVIHDLSPCSQRDSIDAPGTISFKQTLCRSDNEVFYPICLLSKCGIIYQDQIIQVNHAYDVEDDISRLHITVKDLTVNRLFDLKYEIIQISGLDISHNSSNSLMSDLYEIIIEFTRTSYIKDSPILKLSFASYDKLIKLPITEVLFLRSSIISDPQQTWHDLSSHKLVTKFQGLRSHIRSMKQLIESCNLHGKLKAAFVEGHRSLVLFGEFECPIMCKLSLNKSASAGKIEVRCSDETLRDIMSSLIKAQISSD